MLAWFLEFRIVKSLMHVLSAFRIEISEKYVILPIKRLFVINHGRPPQGGWNASYNSTVAQFKPRIDHAALKKFILWNMFCETRFVFVVYRQN